MRGNGYLIYIYIYIYLLESSRLSAKVCILYMSRVSFLYCVSKAVVVHRGLHKERNAVVIFDPAVVIVDHSLHINNERFVWTALSSCVVHGSA